MDKQILDVKKVGSGLVSIFHYIALFVIGAMTVWSAAYAVIAMFYQHYATIQDILLLFIYLEIGAMVGIYFKTNHMPVRFLIYIGITALTRHLVDLVAAGSDHTNEILYTSITTLILAVCVLVVRYASNKYPSSNKEEHV